MKVWGKEVNNCGNCACYNADEFGCGCGNLEIDFPWNFNPYQNIYEKCLFSKPITKEVIEGFGFNEFQKNCYRKGGTEIIVHEYSIGIDMGVEEIQYYINNPVELEFILKSVGVL